MRHLYVVAAILVAVGCSQSIKDPTMEVPPLSMSVPFYSGEVILGSGESKSLLIFEKPNEQSGVMNFDALIVSPVELSEADRKFLLRRAAADVGREARKQRMDSGRIRVCLVNSSCVGRCDVEFPEIEEPGCWGCEMRDAGEGRWALEACDADAL